MYIQGAFNRMNFLFTGTYSIDGPTPGEGESYPLSAGGELISGRLQYI